MRSGTFLSPERFSLLQGAGDALCEHAEERELLLRPGAVLGLLTLPAERHARERHVPDRPMLLGPRDEQGAVRA